MSCKCQDTGTKHCKWEHRQDSHSWNMKQEAKLDRKTTRVELRKLFG